LPIQLQITSTAKFAVVSVFRAPHLLWYFFSPYLACYDFRYGGTITNQIKRLGASCDWTRERFTLDEQLSRKAVFLLAEVEQWPI